MGGVLRAIFGYCFLMLVVRLVGRRPGKQMTPFDYVLVFFMGGVTLTPMVGDDRSLAGAVTIITAIAATHFVIAWLKHRYPTVGRIVDGTPLVLLEKGNWRHKTMRKMRVQEQDVMASARQQGVPSLDQVDYAILERNGDISIIPAEAHE